jgi:hypothetical protein
VLSGSDRTEFDVSAKANLSTSLDFKPNQQRKLKGHFVRHVDQLRAVAVFAVTVGQP